MIMRVLVLSIISMAPLYSCAHDPGLKPIPRIDSSSICQHPSEAVIMLDCYNKAMRGCIDADLDMYPRGCQRIAARMCVVIKCLEVF